METKTTRKQAKSLLHSASMVAMNIESLIDRIDGVRETLSIDYDQTIRLIDSLDSETSKHALDTKEYDLTDTLIECEDEAAYLAAITVDYMGTFEVLRMQLGVESNEER